jgi:hypothetical protein
VSRDVAAPTLSPEQVTIPRGSALARVPLIGGVIGAVGLFVSLAVRAGDVKQFAFSWLVAFLFFLSLALGALFFVLIHFATQAGWGIVVRRLAENTMGTLPLFALLFVPVTLGMVELFPWIHGIAAGKDHVLTGKAPYLNTPFFVGRAVFYFACWSAIAMFFVRRSRAQDGSGNLKISVALRGWSGPAIIVLALTQTFAAVDWIMSLNPYWYSTIFGVYWFAGSFVSFFAFLTLMVLLFRRAGLMGNAVGTEHFHDLGKLLFAFTVFWAYIGFSQFFLIWYGNIPEETIFFRLRLVGSWRTASFILAVGHFIIPFFFFMPRTIKRHPGFLAIGASWLLLMHGIDLYWLVMPALHPEGVRLGLLDVSTFLAVGGFFIAVVSWMMLGSPLVPVGDPRLQESMSFENF